MDSQTEEALGCLGIFTIGCVAVIAFMLGYIALLGWIGFLLYRAYHPAAWPYIGLWEWFGIATLVSIFLPRPAHVTIEK